jgi:hypothetical protein
VIPVSVSPHREYNFHIHPPTYVFDSLVKGDRMAKKGSGLRNVIKVAKAIDRANKKSAREAQQRQKALEREALRQQREQERYEKQLERELAAEKKAENKRLQQIEKKRIADLKLEEKLKKELEKNSLNAKKKQEQLRIKREKQVALEAFQKRCKERELARKHIVDQTLM